MVEVALKAAVALNPALGAGLKTNLNSRQLALLAPQRSSGQALVALGGWRTGLEAAECFVFCEDQNPADI